MGDAACASQRRNHQEPAPQQATGRNREAHAADILRTPDPELALCVSGQALGVGRRRSTDESADRITPSIGPITPVPKAKKRKAPKGPTVQVELELTADDEGLSTAEQKYDPTPIINELRGYVDTWRAFPNPQQWQVTPETARLLQHWRHHQFQGVRPFSQIEAVETAIWLTEVAPSSGPPARSSESTWLAPMRCPTRTSSASR